MFKALNSMEVLWDLTRAVSVEHWVERLIGVNLKREWEERKWKTKV